MFVDRLQVAEGMPFYCPVSNMLNEPEPLCEKNKNNLGWAHSKDLDQPGNLPILMSSLYAQWVNKNRSFFGDSKDSAQTR